MPSSSFGKNITLLIFANLLIKPFYIFGIEAQVQNMVGPNEYGLFFSLYNFCFLFFIILDPGINNYNSKWIAEHRDKALDHIAATVFIKLSLGILFLGLVLIGGFIIGYPTEYFGWLPFVALNFFLASFYVYLKSHFPAFGKYHLESFFSVFDKILLIIILGIQIYLLKDISIETFIYSTTFCYLFVIVVTINLLGSNIQFRIPKRLYNITSILYASFGFALVGLFTSVINRIDGVMLERILPDGYAAGVYAAGYRLLDASNMFAFLFASLLVPMFANLFSKKESFMDLLKESTSMMFCFGVSVASIGYFFASDIMFVLYTEANATYVETFKILILSFFGMGLCFVFGSLIVSTGRLKHLNMLFIFLLLLNLILNYFWIPTEQSIGAAKSTLITQSLMVVGEFAIIAAYFKPGFDIKLVVRMILYIIISIATGWMLSNSNLPWMFKIIAAGTILIFASFLLRLIRWNTLIGQYKE